VHAGFWWGNTGERDHLEELSVYGRIILQWICKKWDWGMDWINLAQEMDRWWAPVNAEMNHPVP
jgi:hypothetical protein